jgi:hypothetical protein
VGVAVQWAADRVDLAVWQGQVAAKTSDPNWIEAWFRDTHGIVMAVPRSARLLLLVDYDLVTRPDGKQVPKLLFARKGSGLWSTSWITDNSP